LSHQVKTLNHRDHRDHRGKARVSGLVSDACSFAGKAVTDLASVVSVVSVVQDFDLKRERARVQDFELKRERELELIRERAR
jgi:hypothetical protein